MRAAAKHSPLVSAADGPDEAEAVEALRALIASGFEEELGS